jgi:hypothetical protein
MRSAALAAAVLAAGCSWTLDRDRDWLPLLGDPPSLAGAPHYSSDLPLAYYQTSDGRIWIKSRERAADDSSGDLILHSFDLAAEERRFPPRAFLTDEGVVVADQSPSSDPSMSRLHLTLDRLGAGPTVTRDVDIPTAMTNPLVVRGPGFFVVAPLRIGDADADQNAPILLVFDNGTVDRMLAGPEGWGVSASPPPPPAAVERSFAGSARFILLQAHRGGGLAAYDVEAHTLYGLGAPSPVPLPMDPGSLGSHFEPPPTYVYDDLQERVWFCGTSTTTVSLVTRETRELPFGCIDLRHQRGGELLVQAPDGAVYALAADGSAVTPLGIYPPYGIRTARGRAFLYVRSAAEDRGEVFSAWLGDTHVIRAGMSPRFSADGRRLYWLEDVAFHAGDLWSLELATRAAHHQVRNVPEFDQLADGRLVAIANAAIDGPFNRAIVVDEAAAESRWLAADMQMVQSVGDAVIAGRQIDSTTDVYRLPLPPRTTK